jgi:choline dehydrogenase-like flavoprotein
MILDAQNLAPQNTAGAETLRAQVCIAGAGAAGIAMALELAKSGVDVLLLEAGGTEHEERSHDFYRGRVLNTDLHQPLEDHRERRLGGSTTVWGGRMVPYDPIDFETRTWMADSVWPVTYDEVAQWFPLANRYAEAGDFDYSSAHVFGQDQQPMIAGFHGTAFSTDTMERFSCPTDFGSRYRERLAASQKIRVLLNAAVTDIVLDESGTRVTQLEVRRPGGDRFTVAADSIVLAAGGLETTRLLLAARSVHREGIGNAHGNLGRFYMAHIAGTVGSFQPTGAVDNAYQVAEDGTYCRRRLALRPEAQRESRIGGFICRLHHTRIADPSHGSGVLSMLRLGRSAVPVRFRTRLVDDESSASDMLHHAVNVVRDVPGIARFAKQMIFDRRLAARKFPSVVIKPRSNRYSLDFHAEQEPNYNSRVWLGTDVDAFGMPRLEVDWRYSQKDVETIGTSLTLFAKDAADSNSGVFSYDPKQVEDEMTRYGAYAGHHLGSTRMGSDPHRSVVDAECRVHGVANLYVAGGSVFATSSQANPTLTMLALALRLAHTLGAPAAETAASHMAEVAG